MVARGKTISQGGLKRTPQTATAQPALPSVSLHACTACPYEGRKEESADLQLRHANTLGLQKHVRDSPAETQGQSL